MAVWKTYYQLGFDPPEKTPEAWAMLAIKTEIVYNGIPQGGMDTTDPTFGKGTDEKVREFQASQAGLDVDGIIGPWTAHRLFRKRVLEVEKKLALPQGMLCKLKSLESSDDPAALSDDKHDRGPVQINDLSHPQVSDKDCYNPSFCFLWAGQYLRSAYDGIRTVDGQKDWDLALASYNVGWGGARRWDRAGRPRTATAYNYVKVVKNRVC